MDISMVTEAAWFNKTQRGFNLTDVPLEFCLLQGEVAEAFTAWREDTGGTASELADVLIYVAGLARMLHIDLDAAVAAKLMENAVRDYKPLPNGVLARVKDEPRG
jgi:hypothetical protein